MGHDGVSQEAVPADWPHANLSRFVISPPHRWHVQVTGAGPDILLIHGAGGSVHSWRDLIAPLSRDHRVIAVDLPGQGFTRLGARKRCGLDPMSEDIGRLLEMLGVRPATIVGHSAGAAIALRLAQALAPAPARIVSVNGALESFPGVAGVIFPLVAKALAYNPFTGPIVSATITRGGTERLIRGTGSHLTPKGIELYHRLFRMRTHVSGTLAMMEQWSLDALLRELPAIPQKARFLVGTGDLAVSPRASQRAAERMPDADRFEYSGAGHLLHEERPDRIAEDILGFL